MIAFCSSLKIGRGLWLFGAFSTTSPSEKRRDTTPRYHLEVSRGSVWAWNRPCHCLVFFSKRRPPLTEKCFSQHRPVWLHFLSLSSATHVAIRPTKWPPVHRWSLLITAADGRVSRCSWPWAFARDVRASGPSAPQRDTRREKKAQLL